MRQSVFNASAPGNYGDSFDVVDVDTVAAVSFLFSFFLLWVLFPAGMVDSNG